MAIVRCDKEKLNALFAEFDAAINAWTGNMVKKLAISYGYASAKDFPGLSIRELALEADKNMYKNKADFYQKSGIERRKN